VTWSEQTEAAQVAAFDIGLMPLPDEPWERGKCGYKLIQYMACGVPVVASPVGANTEIVTPGMNGALADTSEQWLASLTELAEDPALRARQGTEGRKRVEHWYSLQAQAPRLVSMLQEAVRRRQS
jgi:glycosyltransferase involved in cell wall biosynthesis